RLCCDRGSSRGRRTGFGGRWCSVSVAAWVGCGRSAGDLERDLLWLSAGGGGGQLVGARDELVGAELAVERESVGAEFAGLDDLAADLALDREGDVGGPVERVADLQEDRSLAVRLGGVLLGG